MSTAKQRERYWGPVSTLPNSFLCLLIAFGGPVALTAQDVKFAGEKRNEVFVPGSPVTNQSVEAGLLKRRNALRSSPEFQKHDGPPIYDWRTC